MEFFKEKDKFNSELIVSRSGYSGEDGFEISLETSIALDFIEKIFKSKILKPAGLVAWDILRIEAGLCLYGKEMNSQTTPRDANLLWLVKQKELK